MARSSALGAQDAVELLGLLPGTGKAVEHEAVLGPVAGVELLLDDPDHDAVGDEEPAVHVALRLEAQLGSGRGGLTEQVAGRQVVDAVVLGESHRLRPLAGTLLPKQHQPRPSGTHVGLR